MAQQINFLNALPKRTVQLPSYIMGLIVLVLLLICISSSVLLMFSQLKVKRELAEVSAEKTQTAQSLQQLEQAFPLLASNIPLVQRVEEYERALRDKQLQFAKLTHATFRRPFSNYLKTLSIHAPPGLWLTGIKIDQDANEVSLSGYSQRPLQVTIFMEELHKAAAFKDIVFDLFYVHKVKDKNYIEFEIANDKLQTHYPSPQEFIGEEKDSTNEEKKP